MTPDEPDARLTAYALNDPGLSAADRAAVEEQIAADPTARQTVEQARELAGLLTAGYAAELAATAAPKLAEPARPTAKPRRVLWRLTGYVPVAAAVLLLAVSLMDAGRSPNMQFSIVGSALAPKSADRASFADAGPALSNPSHSSSRQSDLGSRRYWNAPEAREEKPEILTNPDVGLDAELPAAVGVENKVVPADPKSSGTVPPASSLPAPPNYWDATVQTRPQQPPQKFRYERKPDGKYVYLGQVGDKEQNPNDSILPQFNGRSTHGTDTAPNNDRFPAMVENAFVRVEGQNALSTFGIDVDTASYAIVRNYLNAGQLPPTAAVRLEEIVNYFPYQDKPPTGDDPFAVTVEVADCPWQPRHRLARIGLKAKPIAADKRPPSNLVFLIDVSGSMNDPKKLPLVKDALRLLVNQLGENDRVAMVVYAGSSGLVLDSTTAASKGRILTALDRLEAGGSTNGAGGLQQAYDVAAANFIKGGTNRVILCTDGDWNVGVTGTTDLVKMIEEKRTTGIFLSVFGFGMGNLRDEMMVKLAGKGNGNYGYIDSAREANKALVEQLSGTLVTVAKDVKIQVEFNPAAVKAYRLLGYEKRALAAKDFADDTKDAGEMGAGHTVTALYELVPAGESAPAPGDGLRYQPAGPAGLNPAAREPASEAFLVKMRHKKPDGNVSTLRELPVPNTTMAYRDASEDFRFSAAAASFALVLRESAHKGNATLAMAKELAETATRFDPSGYRAEFVQLVRRAQEIGGRR